MERMRFQAIDRTGKAVIMEISANDETSAKRQLRRMGYTPVRSVAAREGFSFAGLLKGEHHFDLYHFTCRLSPLLLANIPLERALAVIEEGVKKPKEREVILYLRQGLHEGKSFSALTRERKEWFSPLYSSLVESGEQSGNLAGVMMELKRFLKESKDFKDFVITCSIYPAIVVSVTLGVIFLLFTVFIPRFA